MKISTRWIRVKPRAVRAVGVGCRDPRAAANSAVPRNETALKLEYRPHL